MNTSVAYIAIAIIALAVVALLVFVVRRDRQESRLTPLAAVAFAFVIAGILFGDNRFIGYSLMAVGVILAAVDIFRKSKAQVS
jgi:hypothetical protein